MYGKGGEIKYIVCDSDGFYNTDGTMCYSRTCIRDDKSSLVSSVACVLVCVYIVLNFTSHMSIIIFLGLLSH